jgi:hypothetical protein
MLYLVSSYTSCFRLTKDFFPGGLAGGFWQHMHLAQANGLAPWNCRVWRRKDVEFDEVGGRESRNGGEKICTVVASRCQWSRSGDGDGCEEWVIPLLACPTFIG